MNPNSIRAKVLDVIAFHLYSMGKRLEEFPFICDYTEVSNVSSLTKELRTEQAIVTPITDLSAITELNADQKMAYDRIIYHVRNNISRVFFVDGPGGTGKTFLYKTLLATVRTDNQIALATATSGVAASLLPGGRTSHSRFKIPLNIERGKSCNISKQSTLAYLIRMARLIIWDEATMAKRDTIEMFDEMLQDVMNSREMFGGKIIVFGGDFRQTLPVITGGSKEDIIGASIIMSPLWKSFEKIRLQKNMRAMFDPDFSSYLLRIGDGTENVDENGNIEIPLGSYILFEDEKASFDKLVDTIFPNISQQDSDLHMLVQRAILTTRNEFVSEINDILINKFFGESVVYLSSDDSIGTHTVPDQEELFHSLTPQGLPPHRLVLKKNSPIILLRNLNPTEGLCNGTRLICKEFSSNVIYAVISVGLHTGRPVFIPRITLESPQNSFTTIPFKRKQFPVRLCFAMTINKAQGQTLDFVGVYLKEPVFSHGQLYVALSRARMASRLMVLIRPTSTCLQPSNCTKNVVYNEVLAAASDC